MAAKVELPAKFINILTDLPEQGMGYQVVNVTLKNGTFLTDRRVVNSTFLLLMENEIIMTSEIEKVEPYENFIT